MFRFISSIFRLQVISWILLRNRALFPLDNIRYIRIFYWPFKLLDIFPSKKTKGERLAKAIYELGPVFIKIGQILSTRPDFVGEDISLSLSKLRDDLPHFSFEEANESIKSQFGGLGALELFAEFNETPVAAASVAQVHKAKTFCGRDVAVKILRPNIEKAFKRDIQLFTWIASLVDYGPDSFKKFKLKNIVEKIATGIKIELNLKMEAAAAAELKENMLEDKNVYIPEVFWEVTSERVLTIEWVNGTSIYDIEALKSRNFDLIKICTNLAGMFFNQAYRDGFYHADLHPGNVMIDDQGRIVLIDFGIMGRLSKNNRLFVAEVLYGFLKRDYKAVAEAHYKYKFISAEQDRDIFAQTLRSVGEQIIGKAVKDVSVAKILSELIMLADQFKIEIKSEIVTLQKTIMLVEGIGTILNNDINMWKLVDGWIGDWVTKNLSFDAKIVSFLGELGVLAKKMIEKINSDCGAK
jgi:ubiquinone biosynthesis protein